MTDIYIYLGARRFASSNIHLPRFTPSQNTTESSKLLYSTMVLHNPGNWHWVSVGAAPWAREYLDDILPGISAEEGAVSAKVSKVVSMDGDVDVSQRKGKVITIFDVKLQLEYEG